jgi:hypothetical protein
MPYNAKGVTGILSGVRSSVTNNNGFLDWMIGFIDAFFTISLNRNQLQQLAIILPKTRSILTGLRLSSLLGFTFTYLRMNYE